MRVHVFHAAALAVCHGRSWADACNEVGAILTLADAGDMFAEAERHRHDALDLLIRKLTALGAHRPDWGRCYDVHLDAWWYISPTIGVCFCVDEKPSPDARDWLAEGDLDTSVPQEQRVQALADDVTLVLTDGMGAMVFRTSKRVPTPAKGVAT